VDIYLVVMRLIHIAFAFVWFGAGFYASVILFPSLLKMGTEASKTLAALAKNRAFGLVFPVSGVVTVVAGVLLYVKPGASSHFSSTGWMVLSIGAVAGILAAGHGGATLGKMTNQYIEKAGAGASNDELTALGQKLTLHSNISMALLVIAMLGMEAARYI
jgi:uncharacterized membrane protein